MPYPRSFNPPEAVRAASDRCNEPDAAGSLTHTGQMTITVGSRTRRWSGVGRTDEPR